MGEVPRKGRRGLVLPSQSLRDSSPRVGAKGTRRTDCHTSVAILVRNDMRLTGGNDNFYFGDTYRLHNWRN